MCDLALHGIILEGKPIGPNQKKKNLTKELKVWTTKM
jgi:hypothetical protein